MKHFRPRLSRRAFWVLCALLGRWVENGEYPRDMITLGGLVQDICFNNAKRYFNL